MIYFQCNETIIARAPLDVDAPALCVQLEDERNDGWAVCAWRDGKLVANAEGWLEEEPQSIGIALETTYSREGD